MVIEKVVAKAMEERIKFVPPMNSTLIVLMLESIYEITKTSPKAEAEVSD